MFNYLKTRKPKVSVSQSVNKSHGARAGPKNHIFEGSQIRIMEWSTVYDTIHCIYTLIFEYLSISVLV